MHAKDTQGIAPEEHPTEPPASAPGDAGIEDAIARLRDWGLGHPLVLELMATLTPATDAVPDREQLVWEATSVPGLVVNGERRVSILRLSSRADGTERLVGQVQVLERTDDPLSRASVALYVHAPERAWTCHVEDTDAWFIRVLEAHYERAQGPVALAGRPLPEALLASR